MPEPATIYHGKKAMDIAFAKVEKLLTDAADGQRSEVERCTKFLEACTEIVLGLNQEYDEILVQTANCPESPADTARLRARIDEYLHVDKLRGKLVDAIQGISFYELRFQTSAASVFNWPWRRSEKIRSVEKFTNNLRELRMYLDQLSTQDLPHRSAGSGIGAPELNDIMRTIDAPPAFRTTYLKQLGAEYLAARNKEPMFERVKQIRDVVESLRHEYL
jgi:hypothetical protein